MINKIMVNKEIKDLELKKIIDESEVMFYDYYLNDSLEDLHNEVRLGKKVINKLKKKLNTPDMKSSYEIGVLSGIIRTYQKLLSHQLIENEKEYQLHVLFKSKKTKNLIEYIYNKKIVNTKDIINIYGEYSYEILKKLVKEEFIEKEKYGKNTFYLLTNKSKKILDENIGEKEYDIIESESLYKEKVVFKSKINSYNQNKYNKYEVIKHG